MIFIILALNEIMQMLLIYFYFQLFFKFVYLWKMADVTKITFSGNFRNVAFVILLTFVFMTFVFFICLLQIKSRQLPLIDRI